MKKKALAVGAVFIILVAFYMTTNREEQELDVQDRVGAPGKPTDEVAQTSAEEHSSVRSRRETAQQLERYICHIEKEKCLYDPLAAASKMEAAWLSEHGYPSNAEASELSSLSIDQLTARAALGDTKAEVFLGKALISQGKPKDGLMRLANASAKGSVYASYALAEAHSQDGPFRNPVMGAAYYRLAYMQGDWKASAMVSDAGAEFGPMETAMADRQAMALYRNLLDEKGRSGYQLSISPRPD